MYIPSDYHAQNGKSTTKSILWHYNRCRRPGRRTSAEIRGQNRQIRVGSPNRWRRWAKRDEAALVFHGCTVHTTEWVGPKARRQIARRNYQDVSVFIRGSFAELRWADGTEFKKRLNSTEFEVRDATGAVVVSDGKVFPPVTKPVTEPVEVPLEVSAPSQASEQIIVTDLRTDAHGADGNAPPPVAAAPVFDTEPVTGPRAKGGRPRVHTNDAARVAAWRKRHRDENAEAKPLGRPRKWATGAERSAAWRRRQKENAGKQRPVL